MQSWKRRGAEGLGNQICSPALENRYKFPFLECPEGYILGDFKKSGSPRIGGWGANSYRNSAMPLSEPLER